MSNIRKQYGQHLNNHHTDVVDCSSNNNTHTNAIFNNMKSINVLDFMQEFKDFKLDLKDLETAFYKSGPATSEGKNFRSVDDVCANMKESPLMLRSMIRSRLFCGVIAAGGGS